MIEVRWDVTRFQSVDPHLQRHSMPHWPALETCHYSLTVHSIIYYNDLIEYFLDDFYGWYSFRLLLYDYHVEFDRRRDLAVVMYSNKSPA